LFLQNVQQVLFLRRMLSWFQLKMDFILWISLYLLQKMQYIFFDRDTKNFVSNFLNDFYISRLVWIVKNVRWRQSSIAMF